MQTTQKLSERLYYMPSYQPTDRPILAAIRGDAKTLFLDAGNSANHAKHFKEQLASFDIQGDIIALTHWHWDHVFGLAEMDMPSIANGITYKKVQELSKLSWKDAELDARVEAGIEIPFCADAIKLELGSERDVAIAHPTIVYDEQIKVDLGGVTCLIKHVEADHSPDSSIIYIPEEKTLFLGDCLYANMYAEKWHYTIGKMTKLLEEIESYEAETYFLSHHPAPISKNEFFEFASLLKVCAELTKNHDGNLERITSALRFHLDQELNDDDLEVVEYFVNGYALYEQK